MSKTIAKTQILAALKAGVARGDQPNRLHIPRDLETEMCLLSREDVGDEVARAIAIHGPRRALQGMGNTLFGMTLVWDAEVLKVEEVTEPEQ